MILSDYLMKCVWLNKRGGQLGSIVNEDGQVRFQAFDSDEPEISDFLCALEKDPYGEFLLDFREFGEVLPTPKRSNPWLGPTVHINKADFRTEFGLEETYSLYAGFRALSAIGAPVLLFEGQNPLLKPTQIRFLKVTHRSLNVLQGRILEGDMYAGVREFTAQSLVW